MVALLPGLERGEQGEEAGVAERAEGIPEGAQTKIAGSGHRNNPARAGEGARRGKSYNGGDSEGNGSGPLSSGKLRIAVYPGSFDPVTFGHLDLIERCAPLVDRLIVAVLRNAGKQPLFSPEERVEMLRGATARLENVEVDSFDGLLVEYARQRGACLLLRGIRAISDYEYELQMALMNRRLAPEIETMFMMAGEAYSFLSSRLVKEVIALGGDVSGLVPPQVEAKLKERFPRGPSGRTTSG